MFDLRACICPTHRPIAYRRLSAQWECRGLESARNKFRPLQENVSGLHNGSEDQQIHTLLTPRSSKLCFAAASIDAFVPEFSTNPGAFV